MKLRSGFVFATALVLTCFVAIALSSCGGQQTASTSASSSSSSAAGSFANSSSSSASASAAPASDSNSSGSSQSASDDKVVTISLDYNAGTGYEWGCTIEPEGVMELVSQSADDGDADEQITGGPLHDVFKFRAVSPGEAKLTFELKRFWEEGEEPAETQVYAYTVTDDLEMILNPYKSDFENAPE